MIKIIFEILFLALLLTFSHLNCLPSQIRNSQVCSLVHQLSPLICKFHSTSITLQLNPPTNQSEPLDIKQMFNKLSQNSLLVNTQFDLFYVFNDRRLVTIPADALGKITFNRITVESSSLKRFHSRAFHSSIQTLQYLRISGWNIRNEPAPYSYYDLVNSFPNLKSFFRSSATGVYLTDQAFGISRNVRNSWRTRSSLPYLEYLRLKIASIEGSPFYNLDKLNELIIYSGELNYIPEAGFRFSKNRLESSHLYIDLTSNRLNGSSFQVGALSGITGSLKIILNSNQITYLDQSVFLPFFESNHINSISLSGNPIDCSDCRSYWLFGKKIELSLEKRIESIYCDGNQAKGTIWQKQDKFQDCSHNYYIN